MNQPLGAEVPNAIANGSIEYYEAARPGTWRLGERAVPMTVVGTYSASPDEGPLHYVIEGSGALIPRDEFEPDSDRFVEAHYIVVSGRMMTRVFIATCREDL